MATEYNKPIRLGNVYNQQFTGYSFGGHVWDINGIAPCLKTTAAASQQFIIVEVKDGYTQNNQNR